MELRVNVELFNFGSYQNLLIVFQTTLTKEHLFNGVYWNLLSTKIDQTGGPTLLLLAVPSRSTLVFQIEGLIFPLPSLEE